MTDRVVPLCPLFERSMQLLGKPWTGLIVERLLAGTNRFNRLEAELPISARLLSERLKELEREGVVRRDVYPEKPVRIEYSLTPKGAALEPVVAAIRDWSARWMQAPEESPASTAGQNKTYETGEITGNGAIDN